jgi:tetratricopeptide (TPR) repeat protein
MIARAPLLTAVACVALGVCSLVGAGDKVPPLQDEYEALIARYRSGDAEAPSTLASWPPAEVGRLARDLDCFDRSKCEAAAVLQLESAARSFQRGRLASAAAQGATGGEIVARLADRSPGRVARETSEFLFRWFLAAGNLSQGYGLHADAFALYTAALDVRPTGASAVLARATAIEASVLPDGFGGVLLSEDVLRPLLGYMPGQPVASGLDERVGDPASTDHVRGLWVLAREYRAVLDADATSDEARLRLGRVLADGGHRDEARAELQRAAAGRDPFVVGLAHLCLGRLAETPEEAARWYRAATDDDPSLRPAWLGLSEAAWRMHDRAGARTALEHAFADDDSRLTSWVEYHFGRGRGFPEALAALRARVVKGADQGRPD